MGASKLPKTQYDFRESHSLLELGRYIALLIMSVSERIVSAAFATNLDAYSTLVSYVLIRPIAKVGTGTVTS